MIIITNIYSPNVRTQQTVDSFVKHGYEVAVNADSYKGNGQVLKDLFACFNRAVSGGHVLFTYTDGADTYCQHRFNVPENYLLFSVEKACYPHTWVAEKYPPCESKWKYLNGGGYGGPLELAIQFFERYGLNQLPNDANGQHDYMIAYLQAIKDGFPIKLDTQCEIFQTMAFADPTEFIVTDKQLVNVVTDTNPAILHFNGLTTMEILKQLK